MNAEMRDIDAVMFLVQVFSTFTLTGIVWFVQLVHYPLLRKIARSRFAPYEKMQVLLTGFVVGPPLLLETAGVLYSLWRTPSWMDLDAVISGAVLMGIIWLSTVLLQRPQHRVLQEGFDPRAYRKLLYTNWIRSFAWSFRSLILLFSLLKILTRLA